MTYGKLLEWVAPKTNIVETAGRNYFRVGHKACGSILYLGVTDATDWLQICSYLDKHMIEVCRKIDILLWTEVYDFD